MGRVDDPGARRRIHRRRPVPREHLRRPRRSLGDEQTVSTNSTGRSSSQQRQNILALPAEALEATPAGRAILRRIGDRQRWATAEDAQFVDAVRVTHTSKAASPVAERAAVSIEDRLRTDRGIELTSLRDTVNIDAVAAVEGEVADRAERERQVDQDTDRSVLSDAESPSTPPAQHIRSTTIEWDTAQRRDQHRAELAIAGLDTEAIAAHLLTDTSNTAPLDSTSMHTPTATPEATPGDRGHNLDRGVDRGGR